MHTRTVIMHKPCAKLISCAKSSASPGQQVRKLVGRDEALLSLERRSQPARSTRSSHLFEPEALRRDVQVLPIVQDGTKPHGQEVRGLVVQNSAVKFVA